MRAFILGNGDSLNKHLERGHFDLLNGEITFACNRISLLYDKTAWRPNYWSLFDYRNLLSPHAEIEVNLRAGAVCKVRGDMTIDRNGPGGAGVDSVIRWAREYPTFSTGDCEHEGTQTDRWHKNPAFCKQGGALSVNVQWAVSLGCNPVYVMGCDLGSGHFDPAYLAEPMSEDDVVDQTLVAVHAHQIAKRECESRGVEICNAGIDGELEVYDRVDFEDLIWA